MELMAAWHAQRRPPVMRNSCRADWLPVLERTVWFQLRTGSSRRVVQRVGFACVQLHVDSISSLPARLRQDLQKLARCAAKFKAACADIAGCIINNHAA